MAGLRLGDKEIQKVYLGNNLISDLYLGNTKIWSLKRQLAYRLNDDNASYSVIGRGTWNGPDIEIPDTYNDLPVTSVGANAFQNDQHIETIVLGGNINTVGANAFDNCGDIDWIDINSSIEFKSDSFKDTTVESVWLFAEGIDTWLDCTFFNNYANPLHSGGSLEDDYNGGPVTNLVIPEGKALNLYSFYGCSSIKSLDLTYGVALIRKGCFANNSNLKTIYMTNSTIGVHDSAFSGLSSSAKIEFIGTSSEWNSLSVGSDNDTFKSITPTYVSKGLLYTPSADTTYNEVSAGDCTDTTITMIGQYHGLPVTKIANEGFKFHDLTHINFHPNIVEVGDSAFYYSKLKTCNDKAFFQLPIWIKKLGEYAFYQSNIEGFEILGGSQLTVIPKGAVANGQLRTISLGSTDITYIGDSAFSSLALTGAILPNTVTYIGAGAFANQKFTDFRFTNRTSAAQILDIGEQAFNYGAGDASSYGTYTFPNTCYLRKVGQSACTNCLNTTLSFAPDAEIDKYAFGVTNVNLTTVNFDPIGELKIHDRAFSNCKILANVELPANIKCIGSHSFAQCSLTNFSSEVLAWQQNNYAATKQFRNANDMRDWLLSSTGVIIDEWEPMVFTEPLQIAANMMYDRDHMQVHVYNPCSFSVDVSVESIAQLDGYSDHQTIAYRTVLAKQTIDIHFYGVISENTSYDIKYADITAKYVGNSTVVTTLAADGCEFHPDNIVTTT